MKMIDAGNILDNMIINLEIIQYPFTAEKRGELEKFRSKTLTNVSTL